MKMSVNELADYIERLLRPFEQRNQFQTERVQQAEKDLKQERQINSDLLAKLGPATLDPESGLHFANEQLNSCQHTEPDHQASTIYWCPECGASGFNAFNDDSAIEWTLPGQKAVTP